MINCKKCNYEVPNNLKYAIMNNICPSCGDVLFGDKDMMAISSILDDVLRQEFSDEMNKVIVNDIALFIFNTYVEDKSHNTPDSEPDNASDNASDNAPDNTLGDTPGGDQGGESNERDLARIRDEVRTEIMGEVGDDGEIIDENEDTKIARLKRLARESGLGEKRGISVKRVN